MVYDPKEYSKKYRELNKEKIALKKKEWRENNLEKSRASSRKHYEKFYKKPELTIVEKLLQKESKKEKHAAYYQKNKKSIQEKRTAYYQSNSEKSVYRRLKSRCKKFNIPFDLEVSDIVVPEICPVLNIPIFQNGKKGPSHNSPSVDRINPDLGYTKDNIRIISNRANMLKNNSSVEELSLVLKDLIKCQNGQNTIYLVPVDDQATLLGWT